MTEVLTCPVCGGHDLVSWSMSTIHGDADGHVCEDCETRLGDGQDLEVIVTEE